jgi:hypothetical protein
MFQRLPDERSQQRHELCDAVLVQVRVRPMWLLVEHCREGDDLGLGDDGSEDLGGTFAIETGELVVEDDEVRLFVKRDRNGFDPVRGFPHYIHVFRFEEETQGVTNLLIVVNDQNRTR